MRTDRELDIRIYIQSKLKSIIRALKKDHRLSADDYINELVGALDYMVVVGDISEEVYNRIYKLTFTIRRKYHLP